MKKLPHVGTFFFLCSSWLKGKCVIIYGSMPLMTLCPQCSNSITGGGHWWKGVPYCSARCRHDAGDRSACSGWDCGCTKYAKKRRLLRNHRRNMRIMDDLIADHNLGQELEDRLIEETGNTNFWLGEDSGQDSMDEDSDQEDPEAVLRQQVQDLRREAADKKALLEGAKMILEAPPRDRAVVSDLERARMELEDFRSQALR